MISFAAGIRTSFAEKHLPDDVPGRPRDVERAGDGRRGDVASWPRDAAPTEAHLAIAEELLGYVGKVLRLKETHLDAVTATSGSGPAYFFLLAEAMIEACILLGLSRDVATELIIQTMLGSAKMLRDTGKHPVELREMVTSPGGTTIEAIRHLEEAGVRAAFLNAIDAAKRAERGARAGRRRGRRLATEELIDMGRGDLKKVRSAKDRQRKVKEREARQAAERGAERKAAKKR